MNRTIRMEVNVANNWVKLDVFNGDHLLGSFYTDAWSNKYCVITINQKYGEGNWTRYHIGN